MQNAVRSGMGLLGMHPSAPLTHPLSGQRMAGLLPLELRPNLLQGPGGRFPLLMQPGLAHQTNNVLDASLQARVRVPFSQMEQFNRAEGAFARAPNPSSAGPDNLAKANNETPPRSDVGGQQEGDQDYRFPPPEKQSTGLLKTPPLEMRTEPVPARPPLLERPPRAVEGREGRRENMSGGFRAESRWGPPRGDFDERDMRGMSAGPPKNFQEERSNPNFQGRFDGRGGNSSGPAWNRGTGPSFNANMHQDYDDRRRPWERQKDRDDRDMDFRGEMNGNRHSRERDRERERDRNRDRERARERNRERERERERENEKDKERERWTPLSSQPLLPQPKSQPLLPLPTPLLAQPQAQEQVQMNSPSPPVPPHQPHPKADAEPQPEEKPESPPKETASSEEQEEASFVNGTETDPQPQLNISEPASQTATEPARSPSPSLTSTNEPSKEEEKTPELCVSSSVDADTKQTGPKVNAETEPELEKTDTEET